MSAAQPSSKSSFSDHLRLLTTLMTWLTPRNSSAVRTIVGDILRWQNGVAGNLLYNRFYSTAPALLAAPAAPNTINAVAFDPAFDRIQKHPGYPFLVEILRNNLLTRNLTDGQRTRGYFVERLQKSTALGASLEFLNILPSHPQATPQQLLAACQQPNIYYFEMLHQMDIALANRKHHLTVGRRIGNAFRRDVDEPNTFTGKNVLALREKVLAEHQAEIERLTPVCEGLKNELHRRAGPLLDASDAAKLFSSEECAMLGRLIILKPTDQSMRRPVPDDAVLMELAGERGWLYHHSTGVKEYRDKQSLIADLQRLLQTVAKDAKISFERI
jgi:hypothetical protein